MFKRAFGAALLVCAGSLTFGLSSGTVHASAGGNAAAAHACQQGGYQNLVGLTSADTPVTFSNTGECVSYAAHGNTLYMAVQTATTTLYAYEYPPYSFQDTSINIASGDVAVTTATGTVWFNGCSGGTTTGCTNSGTNANGSPDLGNGGLQLGYNGALIGNVDGGAVFPVGTGPTGVTQVGEYYLGLDTDNGSTTDNAGSFMATTTLYQPVA